MADVTLEVTSTQINNGIKKANAINGTASEINDKLAKADSALQEIPDTYVLKADVATINNQSLLNGGNIDIQGGTGGGLDIDLSNLSDTGKKVIDGQWIPYTGSLSANLISGQKFPVNTSRQTLTIDLSEYLPKDDYSYEVLLGGEYSTGKTTGALFKMFLSSTIAPAVVCMGRCISVSNSANTGGGNAIIPVAKDRLLYMKYDVGVAETGTVYLTINSYRRIGTNQ